MSFDVALVFLLKEEGGYVDDPVDRGGATNQGITQSTYSAWRAAHNSPDADVKNIASTDVAAIYRDNYFFKGRCDALRDRVGLAHFDGCVNIGLTMAAKLLQRACGVTDDGVIGPTTLATANTMIEDRLLALLLMERRGYYHKIVEAHPEQEKFLPNWTKRLKHLTVALWP